MILWHNPRCSKSREALELLRARGIEPVVREYLKDAPTRDEIADVARMLGGSVLAIMRRGEPEFAALGLDTTDDVARIAAMAAHPRLIERPILVSDDRAVIGRPPERVLELID